MAASFTIISLTDAELGPNRMEDIFLGENGDPDVIRRGRRTLNEVRASLRLLYSQDPLENISQDMLEVVI